MQHPKKYSILVDRAFQVQQIRFLSYGSLHQFSSFPFDVSPLLFPEAQYLKLIFPIDYKMRNSTFVVDFAAILKVLNYFFDYLNANYIFELLIMFYNLVNFDALNFVLALIFPIHFQDREKYYLFVFQKTLSFFQVVLILNYCFRYLPLYINHQIHVQQPLFLYTLYQRWLLPSNYLSFDVRRQSRPILPLSCRIVDFNYPVLPRI